MKITKMSPFAIVKIHMKHQGMDLMRCVRLRAKILKH